MNDEALHFNLHQDYDTLTSWEQVAMKSQFETSLHDRKEHTAGAGLTGRGWVQSRGCAVRTGDRLR